MCEFMSWVEKGDKVYFLTREQIDSPLGETLKRRFPGTGELTGHAAIRAYYDLENGKNMECTDFSTPDNFPDTLVTAIKEGQFRGFGTPTALLSEPAWAEYDKIQKQATAEYDKIHQLAWAEYEKIRQLALAEYEKICQLAWAEYEKICHQARAEYNKICHQAFWDLFAIPENRAKAWR